MLNKLTDAVTSRIERARVLDRPGDALADAVAPVYSNPVVKHVAAGTPIGHPLHPLLVPFPIVCFIGALLMALVANYAGFLAPKVALVSNIILMIAILLWRPAGLYSRSRG